MAKEQDNKRDHLPTDEAAEILRRALGQPGVKEMMAVYGEWESVRGATDPYRQAGTRKKVISTADTSERTLLRTI